MFDRTQVRYGVALLSYGWHRSPKRAVFRAGKWLGVGLGVFTIIGTIGHIVWPVPPGM